MELWANIKFLFCQDAVDNLPLAKKPKTKKTFSCYDQTTLFGTN